MCFSASVSFCTAGVLAVTGIASVARVKSRLQLPFAAIPFVFAVQQLCEGFLWLELSHLSASGTRELATVVFLLFALVIWPLYVPFAIYLTESDARRKRRLQLLLVPGMLVSLYMGYSLMLYDAGASVANGHIHYALHFPLMESVLGKYAGSILYFLPTVIPPFVSRNRKMQWIGIALLLSYVITRFFFDEFVISVWCFFAALISVGVVYAMKDIVRTPVAGTKK